VFGMPWWALAQGVPHEFDGSKFQLKAPEPNPKSGGVLKYGITMRPPHFDFHQSGTINSLGSQGCMFDNLVRRDPRDSGKTIIPDLAHSWEIDKEGKTYTFHLREGVTFHDGADFTSEDVKATFDRISKPPQGISIPRSTLFAAVAPAKRGVIVRPVAIDYGALAPEVGWYQEPGKENVLRTLGRARGTPVTIRLLDPLPPMDDRKALADAAVRAIESALASSRHMARV